MTHSPTQGQKQILERLETCFRRIGYKGEMIAQNYWFADFSTGRDYCPKQIPLATFAQTPPSYRNACFGVVFSNGLQGAALVDGHRALGAPQIFEVNEDHVNRWSIKGVGDTEFLGKIKAREIERVCETYKAEWSPRRVLEAKTYGVQLDFVDTGLLPALEVDIRTKLDQLLKDAIYDAEEAFNNRHPRKKIPDDQLFRLLFRLIAAKVFKDRNYKGNWDFSNPSELLKNIQRHYGLGDEISEPVLSDPDVQLMLSERIKDTIHFQNLSVESLAFIYEETLVTPKTRKIWGIHSTPPEIAEYIVRHLPFENLRRNNRRVLEPFSGNGVFLVAAMRRLKELLPASVTPNSRHKYFTEMLCGIEMDPFAREVSKLCLTLADYPNPDGWNLIEEDIFAGSSFEKELSKSSIVLCNPPFEKFDDDEREKYSHLSSIYKPHAILRRILASQFCPNLLGFVLPYPSFVYGSIYREIRELLAPNFNNFEIVVLPDKVFRHSDSESVLLLCSNEKGVTSQATRITSKKVEKGDIQGFYSWGTVSYEAERITDMSQSSKDIRFWTPPLSHIWTYLGAFEKLGSLTEIHRGIEFIGRLRDNRKAFISDKPRKGFKRGLDRVQRNLEPFISRNYVYLNVRPAIMRIDAHLHPWDKPKVIANVAPISRGPWRLITVPDKKGLVVNKRFYGIWPRGYLPYEVIAAILNGPTANAYVSAHEGKRDIHARTLKAIPIPNFDSSSIESITNCVNEYIAARIDWLSSALGADEAEKKCHRLLRRIDALVLKAYDLPPRYERELLDFFRGHQRPGPVSFTEYIPEEFTA